MTAHSHARASTIRIDAMDAIYDAIDRYDRRRMQHARFTESGNFRMAYHFRVQAEMLDAEARYQAGRLWRVGMRAASNDALRALGKSRRTQDDLLREVHQRLRRAAKCSKARTLMSWRWPFNWAG